MQTIKLTAKKTNDEVEFNINLVYAVLKTTEGCAVMGTGGAAVIVTESKEDVMKKLKGEA